MDVLNQIVDINVFSDDSDEDEEDKVTTIRRPYTMRVRTDHIAMWDDRDFFARFRLTKKTVMEFLPKIKEHLIINYNQ